MPGTLFVVATPIGNLEDITARALRVLREVAIIAAEDTRRTSHLLARYAIATPTTSLHEHNESEKSAALVARLARGESVALVSDAGTPTISDPGQGLIRGAVAAGIRVEPVPGPNAAIAALAVSGLPSDTFCFMGFPPTKPKARAEWMARAKAIGGTIVFYEAPHRIRQTLMDLQRSAGDCTIVVGRELTKAHEELVRGPISAVLNALSSELGEFTVVAEIGHQANTTSAALPTGRDLLDELGHIQETTRHSKRRALAELARRYGMPPNEIYTKVEEAKKLVE